MDGKKGGNQQETSLTLKYLLENPSLLQPPENDDEGKCKDDKAMEDDLADLTSAYLGPQIWNEMLLSDDLKLEPVNLDDLLDPAGGNDMTSDLDLLMSNQSPKTQSGSDQQQCCDDDLFGINYNDMPQLMSAHTPISAKQMPNPTDYFNSAPKPSCQQQTHPADQSMRLSHPPVLQSSFDNQQFNQKYKVMEPAMKPPQLGGYPDVHSFMPDFQPSQPHPLHVNMPPPTNQAGKRPRHASLSAVMQHSSPHPVSVQPAALTRQHSMQGFARPQDKSSLVSQHQTSRLSVPNGSTAIPSPISPAEIHIPSPKNLNYVPNSADVIISTPQDPERSPFDPSTRCFTEEELKPQPIIRKSKKILVAPDSKDNKYWSRRNKNNVAAKRSREARRIKENQIAMRANYLERENAALKTEIAELRKELTRAVEMVQKYEKRFPRIEH